MCIFLTLSARIKVKKKLKCSHSVVSDSLQPMDCSPPGFLCAWNSLGKNTGMGCDSLLQGIFPAQGLNLGLLHCRQILHHLSHREA